MKLNQAVSNNEILFSIFVLLLMDRKTERESPPKGFLADCTSSIFLGKQFIPTSTEKSQGKYTRQAR